jgi:hypothetical protein
MGGNQTLIKTDISCRQIEKVSIVRQVGQFAKSMPFTSARNTHRKRQYRESGFVLVRTAAAHDATHFAVAAWPVLHHARRPAMRLAAVGRRA